jgi:cobalt-zinc-cadmium efflux system protein
MATRAITEIMHAHNHAHHSAHHHHHHHAAVGKPLLWTLVLIIGFAGVEAIAGWISGSLALLGDAGHMVSDATALGIALLAAWIATKPPSNKHSYGLGRAEVVAALINGLFMIVIVVSIIVAAVERIQTPQPVTGSTVMWVAALGLLINLLAVFILSGGEQNLNIRGALLHVIGDLLGSVAALISGAVIYFTGWTPIDPILSVFICMLILFSSLQLLREVLQVIMASVPSHVDLPQVGRAMAGVDGVDSVHDLHIWTLSGRRVALSAHLVVHDFNEWQRILQEEKSLLDNQFGIDHITLQPEVALQVIKPISLLE